MTCYLSGLVILKRMCDATYVARELVVGLPSSSDRSTKVTRSIGSSKHGRRRRETASHGGHRGHVVCHMSRTECLQQRALYAWSVDQRWRRMHVSGRRRGRRRCAVNVVRVRELLVILCCEKKRNKLVIKEYNKVEGRGRRLTFTASLAWELTCGA